MRQYRATIVPWYREEDYPQIRKIMSDGSRFPETFQEWLRGSNWEVQALERLGHSIQRVHIEPAAFAVKRHPELPPGAIFHGARQYRAIGDAQRRRLTPPLSSRNSCSTRTRKAQHRLYASSGDN
jgi:hypothetical protein